MKIIDKYLLKTYVKNFFAVFFILYFIFILQAVWMFIDQLAGKDLDFMLIIKFFYYNSPNIIPMVLPLSVLLSSIMMFGDLSEHYEFAAMKSAGISLFRAMRPLIYFMLILVMLSFWFTNFIAPQAEYKFVNLKQEIIHTKPSMAISAGQFTDIENFNIRVDNKSGENEEYLDKVTLHVKSNNGLINKTVIKAKSGKVETIEKDNILKLHLNNGNYYEDVQNKTNLRNTEKFPFAKGTFEQYTINMDLAKLNNQEKDLQEISNTAKMLNMSQLTQTIDSLDQMKTRESKTYLENNLNMLRGNNYNKQATILYKNENKELFDQTPKNQRLNILRNASSVAENISYSADNNKIMLEDQQKNINRHWLSFYDKLVVPFSCLLMFFIGAPLGAIIRKGGMGLPMVFAVVIFIAFHFINTFGKKLAQENGIHVFFGSWLATLVLLPLAIILTFKAAKDRGISSPDTFFYPITKTFKKYFKKNKTNVPI